MLPDNPPALAHKKLGGKKQITQYALKHKCDTIEDMRGKIVPVLSILSLFGILAMLNYTAPPEVGVLGVLVFFTMVFMVLFGVMSEIVKIFQRILKDKNGGEISENKTYMYATVLAFGPIVLLVTRSVSLMTVVLAAIFVILGCFLIYKRA